MKGLRLRLRHLLLLIAACAAFLAVFQYRREVYDPTFARLRRVRYGDVAGKVEAIRLLMDPEMRSKDPAVVETLLGALGDADPAVRAEAARTAASVVLQPAARKGQPNPQAGAVKAALTEALGDRDPTVRLRAAEGLSMLDVKSEEIGEILLRAARTADDPDHRFTALNHLAYSYRDNPEALSAILGALTNRDQRVRMGGISALNLYLRRPAPAIPETIEEALFARLDDEDDYIRGQAAFGLSHIGRKVARRAVPALIRKLDDPGVYTQQWSANALRGFGLEAEEALPALRALAKGVPEDPVRSAAEEAVEAIDKAARTFREKTLPGLIADLDSDDPEIRAAAAAGLAEHGPRARAAVPKLARLRDDPEPKVRRAASAALEASGAGRPE
jgi:HEAT repeat protein